MTSFQEKRVVTLFGHEIKLTVCCTKRKGNEEKEDEDDEKKDEGHNQDKDENEQEAVEGDIELI